MAAKKNTNARKLDGPERDDMLTARVPKAYLKRWRTKAKKQGVTVADVLIEEMEKWHKKK